MRPTTSFTTADPVRRSLLLLGAIVTIALLGLALDGNWPKVLRVAVAAGTYAAVLLVLLRPSGDDGKARRWWWFAVAALSAGVASGLLRSGTGVRTIAIDSVAAVVLATVHWIGLAQSEWVRRKITGWRRHAPST